MKKLKSILLMCLVFGATHSVMGQVKQGNIIIDPYYGFPNFGRSFADGIDVATNDIEVTGIGPAGLRVEYMIADNFGIGFDAIYNSTNLNFQVDSLNNDGSVFQTYDVKTSMQRLRVHLRANYHFVQNEEMDAYLGFGAGTNKRYLGLKTDHPDYEDDRIGGAISPVSFRAALGTRYYFTENVGLNAELGLGGPVVSFGISIKL